MTDRPGMIYDPSDPLDPLGDQDLEAARGARHNRARVGSGRPSSLLYTYGPGAIMDLPQLTVMPAGLDDWERIWDRRGEVPVIHAPRLRRVVGMLLQARDVELRPFPWQPKLRSLSTEGNDLGVSARIFPQWLRCTGCDWLAPLPRFDYRNTHPFRPDEACFEHLKCSGRKAGGAAPRPATGRPRKPQARTAVPARYLLACQDGHLDEFPYSLWVHRGEPCSQAGQPDLKMDDRTGAKGASAVITCQACGQHRAMNEAQGEAGRAKLPRCRGRHPHLDAFFPGCPNQTHLMLVGASNLWFAVTQSIIVMPESPVEQAEDVSDRIRTVLGDLLPKYRDQPDVVRDLLRGKVDVSHLTDAELSQRLAAASAPPPTDEATATAARKWDPVDLLVPEWTYLLQDPIQLGHEDPASGLTLSLRPRGERLPATVSRVLAVERLRKVNALVGFTRIDDPERVDLQRRMVPLTRAKRPKWTVATEDRGEGVFLQLDEQAVQAWEGRVEDSSLWSRHKEAHGRNYEERLSETAERGDADARMRPPRYWLVHTFAHVLIREMAMGCGYSAASLSERLYAWPGCADRDPAAGLLICTTASDSDGTLGGLVQLSEPDRLERVVLAALMRATRCSSDPVCAMRTPTDPEDFLHGAACHCCVMASETSCERANRFLDRRFLIDLPGSSLGFFDRPD